MDAKPSSSTTTNNNHNSPQEGTTPSENRQSRQASRSSAQGQHKKARKPRGKQTDPPPTQSPRAPTPPAVDHSVRISNVRDQTAQAQSGPSPRFTAHLQPYPGPQVPSYIMNPQYPINGSPYQSPSPFHQPPTGATQNGHGAHIGPGIPGHAPYGYPMPHPAYATHGYPSYPQYAAPSSMMVYSAPGPSQVEPQPEHSPVPPSASTTGKRKRNDTPRGGSTSSGPPPPDNTKKRTKTQRACDSCRSRKIRCDVLPDADPPVCQHCKQYGFECTFFLPITETRFKKKKVEEEIDKEKERISASPHGEPSKNSDVKVFGPTSTAYLLHSQAMLSSRTYENYDMRYHHSWDISSNGDGVIQVHEPRPGELELSQPKPADLRIERDVVEKLVNAYFTEVAPILPVITREEFIASSPPQPILLYSICLVAASRREVSHTVFDSIRYAVNSLIKAEDVLSTASIVNLQSLLILAMVGDCHSQFVPNALSALWIRLGAAIRMGQDLGLHRAEAVKQQIELRRRLWSICVICDRWISITYGHPYMISVEDCDARLPSSGDSTDLYLDHLVRLSVIVGRVQKTIYTPAGLNGTNDEALEKVLADIEGWRQRLPAELQFRGVDSPQHAGILFMLYCCLNMLFWRVFMRISYACPEHLKFTLTVEKWTQLVKLTGDAIDWLDAHENLYDVWLLVAYSSTSCALVQYHTCVRRQDEEAQAKLRKLRDTVRRWEAAISPDHMSARRKTAEIISLLYESTQRPVSQEAPVLNPTGGVKVKAPYEGLAFRKDPTRQGGGVFVSRIPSDAVDKHLPEGTIIPDESEDDSRQQAHPTPSAINFIPLRGNLSNMNPALNVGGVQQPASVQVVNPLESSNTLEQLTVMDNGLLEGIPGSMFDWGQWDTYFARINPQAYQQQQQQHMQQNSVQGPQYQHYASSGQGTGNIAAAF